VCISKYADATKRLAKEIDMDPIVGVGLVGFSILILLFLLRVPIGFAMALVGTVGVCYILSPSKGFGILARDIFTQFSSLPLSTIPMFVLMGYFVSVSKISQKLYDAAHVWVGALPGGLCVASVLACACFSAACGSTVATAATMGKIALPEMRKKHYSDDLATGSIAAAGTLGILIPPSNVLIVYGILSEQGIVKLFMAGLVPGVFLALLFALLVCFMCLRDPALGPPGNRSRIQQKLKALGGVVEISILFILVIGGLLFGWFTPSQAGAIGAMGAVILGLIRRDLKWRDLIAASKEGLETSCAILMIITGAVVFGHFMALCKIPFALVAWVEEYALSPHLSLFLVCLIFLIGGCFMDSMALVVLLIPIIMPLIVSLRVDLIWFGVIVVVLTEIGVITPPVGVNVYVLKMLYPDIALSTIFKGILPFLPVLMVFIIILIIFPQLVTFLPSTIGH
jgi:C4-dicarboxylate transporter DctM subunit